MFRRIFVVSLVASVAAVWGIASAGAAATPKPVPYEPGSMIWTCASIAANPVVAAAAGVSCDPTFAPTFSVMPGLLSSATATADGGGLLPMADGCQRVPGSGFIGQGVFANSSAEYANQWNWGQGTWGELYTWYLKKTDDSTYTWGYGTAGDNAGVPANVYYWKVQNNGADAQAWNVCYYTS